MLKIYVVNEWCEIDHNYNNCHKAFTDKGKAIEFAKEIFDSAVNDLNGDEYCTINTIDDCNYQVYNGNYSIEVHIGQ